MQAKAREHHETVPQYTETQYRIISTTLNRAPKKNQPTKRTKEAKSIVKLERRPMYGHIFCRLIDGRNIVAVDNDMSFQVRTAGEFIGQKCNDTLRAADF